MSSKTICGVTCPLSVSYKKFVYFADFRSLCLDLFSVVHSQKREKYFDMLNRPFYPILMTEFWVNVSLKQLGQNASCIQSNVFGIPITIIHALIAKVIQCKETSVYIDVYNRKSPFIEEIPHKTLASSNKLASVSSLLLKEKIWHKLLCQTFIHTKKLWTYSLLIISIISSSSCLGSKLTPLHYLQLYEEKDNCLSQGSVFYHSFWTSSF